MAKSSTPSIAGVAGQEAFVQAIGILQQIIWAKSWNTDLKWVIGHGDHPFVNVSSSGGDRLESTTLLLLQSFCIYSTVFEVFLLLIVKRGLHWINVTAHRSWFCLATCPTHCHLSSLTRLTTSLIRVCLRIVSFLIRSRRLTPWRSPSRAAPRWAGWHFW